MREKAQSIICHTSTDYLRCFVSRKKKKKKRQKTRKELRFVMC